MQDPRFKRTTYTTATLDYLRQLDDFATAKQIRATVGAPRIQSTLVHLQQHNCIDCIAVGTALYWFALPCELDTRGHVINERKVEHHRKGTPRPRKVQP